MTDEEIDRFLYLDDPHQRVYGTVGLFADRILEAKREEESKPELWFVIVPDRVKKYCRPKSFIKPEVRQAAIRSFRGARQEQQFLSTRSLFADINVTQLIETECHRPHCALFITSETAVIGPYWTLEIQEFMTGKFVQLRGSGTSRIYSYCHSTSN